MPYHPLGLPKAQALGRTLAYKNKHFPSKEDIESWRQTVQSYTSHSVKTDAD